MSSTGTHDFDEVLKDVADETRKETDVDDLGKALGFSTARIDGYKVGNKEGKECDGSRAMLRDWRKKQTKDKERGILRQALENVGRIDLCEKHFGVIEENVAAGSQGARSGEQKLFSMGTFEVPQRQ